MYILLILGEDQINLLGEREGKMLKRVCWELQWTHQYLDISKHP